MPDVYIAPFSKCQVRFQTPGLHDNNTRQFFQAEREYREGWERKEDERKKQKGGGSRKSGTKEGKCNELEEKTEEALARGELRLE